MEMERAQSLNVDRPRPSSLQGAYISPAHSGSGKSPQSYFFFSEVSKSSSVGIQRLRDQEIVEACVLGAKSADEGSEFGR